MKRLLAFLAITLMILISCDLQTDDPTSPTDPDPGTESITITAPSDGDTLTIASTYNIRWTSTNVTKLLIIEYTLDNGNSWNLIVNNTDNDGDYIWAPIPNVETNSGRVRITTEDSSYTALSSGFFIISRESSKALAVTQPNGGEQWPGNSSQTITWFSSGVSKVNIEYTLDNGLIWISIDTGIVSNGFYAWDPLPNTPSSNAKIRIIDADDPATSDESDNVFVIIPEDAINVVSPNGGEQWLSGSSQYIRWSTGYNEGFDPLAGAIIGELGKINYAGKGKNFNTIRSNTNIGAGDLILNNSPDEISTIVNVKIEYSENNGASWTTVAASVQNNGLYFWNQIPTLNSSLCIVRISNADGGLPSDVSDSPFSIFDTLPQELIVTSPNGGEIWEAGTTEIITWNSENVANVKIEFTTNNGVNWTTIVESTISDGFYTWEKLPNEASTNSRIRISDAADGTPADISDNFFVIAPEPEINVISPNGGETLQSGGSINILWTSTNIAEVKIEYTMNNGAEWILIASDVSSTGTYPWLNIPDVNSSQVRIKVSDALDNMPFDISDANLAITNQIVKIIEVTSPNGGEVWEASTSKNITWNSTAITSVNLEYTSNNGLNWIQIETNVLSSGSYDWNVPNVNSTQAKVRVSDGEGGETSDESNGTFKIKQAGILRLITPESGDVWMASELYRIEWEAQNVEKVKIEYTTTNAPYDPEANWFDDQWFDLVTNTPGAAGFYETRFTIPSTKYRLRISDAEFNEPVDFSGLFTVKEQPLVNITVISPNGGEQLPGGGSAFITWQSQNVLNVKIEYSLNSGAEWTTLEESIPTNPGSYEWNPVVISFTSHGLIRISDALRSEINDQSDAPFLILDQGEQIIGEPASIYFVSQSFDAIGVTESGSPETAQITFEVQDSSGIPIDLAHAVDVSFRLGAQPGGGEFLAPSFAQTDANGRVVVNLTSGTRAGAVQVIAEIDFGGDIIRSRPVSIAIHGGMPDADHFSIAPLLLNYPHLHILNGEGRIAALVGDKYSNPVRPQTAVYFSTEAGVIEGSNLTDDLGRTSVTILSGAPQPNDLVYGPGFFYVTGETIDENDLQITTTARVLYSGYPQITISPTSVTIPNGGSQFFTYTVMDENGNPLAAGNNYTVTVSTEGDAAVRGDANISMPDVQFGNTDFIFEVYDSKPEETKLSVITVTVSVVGPNGVVSASVSGTTN